MERMGVMYESSYMFSFNLKVRIIYSNNLGLF
jgi:hypothetical protein